MHYELRSPCAVQLSSGAQKQCVYSMCFRPLDAMLAVVVQVRLVRMQMLMTALD